MAVEDARIKLGFPAHPKTKKLAKRLGPAGPLGIVYLFLHAAGNRFDGDLSGMSDEDIELVADWGGDIGEFVSAAIAVGFLAGEPGVRRIHGWAEHNPWAASFPQRSAAARSKAHARWERRTNAQGNAGGMETDADGNAGSIENDAQGNAPSPSPSPIPPPSPTPEKAITPDGVIAAGEPAPPVAGEGEEESPAPKAPPACPHQQIIGLYHQLLPTGRRVRDWNDTRQAHLRGRWAEKSSRQTLDWWRKFFEHIAKSDFLMGRAHTQDGRKPFQLGLDWIVKRENFVKIIEGKYHQ